jgi:hypothetical protein
MASWPTPGSPHWSSCPRPAAACRVRRPGIACSRPACLSRVRDRRGGASGVAARCRCSRIRSRSVPWDDFRSFASSGRGWKARCSAWCADRGRQRASHSSRQTSSALPASSLRLSRGSVGVGGTACCAGRSRLKTRPSAWRRPVRRSSSFGDLVRGEQLGDEEAVVIHSRRWSSRQRSIGPSGRTGGACNRESCAWNTPRSTESRTVRSLRCAFGALRDAVELVDEQVQLADPA